MLLWHQWLSHLGRETALGAFRAFCQKAFLTHGQSCERVYFNPNLDLFQKPDQTCGWNQTNNKNSKNNNKSTKSENKNSTFAFGLTRDKKPTLKSPVFRPFIHHRLTNTWTLLWALLTLVFFQSSAPNSSPMTSQKHHWSGTTALKRH